LHIEVDDGISDADGVTWGRSKTVVGTLPEGGLKVEIFYRMTGATANALLTSRQYGANETALNIPNTLPADGAITLTVRMTDAAGNSTDDSLDIFLDTIPLSAQFADLPDVSPDVTRLTFSAPLLDANQILAGTDPDGQRQRGGRGLVRSGHHSGAKQRLRISAGGPGRLHEGFRDTSAAA
jgi:hypothetical protein